jgi:ABC-type transport system substrate-binding protein
MSRYAALALTFRAGLLALATGVVALAGCGGDGARDDDSAAGLRVYRHSADGSPTSLDPVQAATAYANMVVVNAYDTLYSYRYLARPYELKPSLAAALPEVSADGLVYTIPLRQGVRFIDDAAFAGGLGREVVAEDVVYSIKRHFDPATRPQGAWLWQGRIRGLEEWKAAGSDYDAEVSGLRAVDRHTLQITLEQPFPQLVYTLAMGFSAVVPREAVERYGKEFSLRPVGSGPFRVVAYDTARIVMEPNPGYRWEPVDIYAEGYDPDAQGFAGLEAIHGQQPPFVDRLIIDFIQDSAARWNSFTKGNEIQFSGLPVELVDTLLAARDPVRLIPEYAARYQVASGLESGFVYQNFNMDFPEFGYNPDPMRERRNHALRCAIVKAFDWERRNESFYFDMGVVFPGIIPPAVPEFDPDLSRTSVTRDVPGARRLLAENGWTAENLPELLYATTGGVRGRQFYEQLRAWLKEIGYPPKKVVLKQYATFGDLNQAVRESELPWIAMGWGLDYPDAENTLQLFYGPNRTPGSNSANYANPAYDALFEQAAVMQPSPERTAIYRRMNQMLIDDCVTVSGLSRQRIYVWHRDVIAWPEADILGGFFLPYVALADSFEASRD